MEVGEYIRTTDGYIRKIKIINTDKIAITYYGKIILDKPYKNSKAVKESKIKSHSKNIIDLIEVGDIIEHKIEEDIFKDEVWKIENGKIICTDGFENAVISEDIIAIVTKEQFNNIKYEVE